MFKTWKAGCTVAALCQTYSWLKYRSFIKFLNSKKGGGFAMDQLHPTMVSFSGIFIIRCSAVVSCVNKNNPP
jgi:hypothetical protein